MYPGYDPEFIERLLYPIKYLETINAAQIISEGLVFILAAICIYHGFKTFGKWKTILFFIGSFLYTGLEENIFIIAGKLFHGVVPDMPETYAFNYGNYSLWILAVPLVVYVAWFVIAYSAVHIAGYFFTKDTDPIIKTAALGGLIAVNLDLMVDPIAVRYSWWGWFAHGNEAIYLLGDPNIGDLGIPISNFIGWFMLIFIFAIYWRKITDKADRGWSVRKTVTVFCLGLIPLLIGTVMITGGITILLTPLNGVYFPIPFGG